MSKPMSKTKRAIDRYDLEIEDIENAVADGVGDESEVIFRHWDCPNAYGGLFAYCTADRKMNFKCGCLTQVKEDGRGTDDPKLTKSILRSSLPGRAHDVKLRHLRQFARWQRKMDAMWPGRGEMQMPEGFEERLRKANS